MNKPQLRFHQQQPVIGSHDIASAFQRPHSGLLTRIQSLDLLAQHQAFPDTYQDRQGRTQPQYRLTLPGFERLTARWRRSGDAARRQQWCHTWQGFLEARAAAPACDGDTTGISLEQANTLTARIEQLSNQLQALACDHDDACARAREAQERARKAERKERYARAQVTRMANQQKNQLVRSAAPSRPTGLQTIAFHGQSLYLIEKDGEPYVPMKPVVEGMGLAWQTQHRKFSSNAERFCVTMMVMQMPGDDQKREVICLPLKKIFGWLMTIQPSRVKPEIRDSVIRYQDECDAVLWNYWTQGQATNPRIVLPNTAGTSPAALPDPRVLLPAPPGPRFIDKARAVGQLRDDFMATGQTFSLRALTRYIQDRGFPVAQSHLGYYLYTVDTLARCLPSALEAGLGRPAVASVQQIHRTWNHWWQQRDIGEGQEAEDTFLRVVRRLDMPDFLPGELIPPLEREACVLLDMSPQETALALAWPDSLNKKQWH